jgi:hypothetical protein
MNFELTDSLTNRTIQHDPLRLSAGAKIMVTNDSSLKIRIDFESKCEVDLSLKGATELVGLLNESIKRGEDLNLKRNKIIEALK